MAERRPSVRPWALAALAVGLLPTLAWLPARADPPTRPLARRPLPAVLAPPGAPRDGPRIGSAPGDEALRGIDLAVRPGHAAERVVVLSVDGLRPDAIDGRTPVLAWMLREGTVAPEARTLTRSSTLPSHGAMLTGVSPEVNGLDFNARRPERGRTRFPSVFRVARAAGYETLMVVGKRKLEHVAQDEDLDRFEVPGYRCDRVNRVALPALEAARRGLAFLHYPDPDAAGHRHGWMTRPYLRAVRQVDACVADLLATLYAGGGLDRTLLVLTSDHGGHGRTHGSDRELDRRIPWVAIGGPARRAVVARPVDTQDTATTVLEALGLPSPRGVEGRPVTEALGAHGRRLAPVGGE